ncbi:DUF4845 domain-containing protein [Massilia sp. PAMC28688]|uniref:DUF4845 domain-containing protein n=1 Tax=Massilia sp. PAMC28688 TaxID=2861283 RepID=UPI001C63346A|nr:DUF4845 domain-containing protein [Massilia sp. PAMC28688]QYF92576.1 DUF4845 domain-containing protein [Massilia sp. PAMC28688]
MNGSKLSLHAQRGVSLSGLLVVLAVLVVVAVLAMKVVPTYTEYLSAKDAIAAAKATNGTPSEMKGAFVRAADINNIRAIKSSDLIIEKVDGQSEVSFDYDAVVPLFTNVKLVIRYAATTAADGVVPDREEADPEKK